MKCERRLEDPNLEIYTLLRSKECPRSCFPYLRIENGILLPGKVKHSRETVIPSEQLSGDSDIE